MSFNYPCSKLWFFCKKWWIENSITYIYKMDKYPENPGGFERQKENDGFEFI